MRTTFLVRAKRLRRSLQSGRFDLDDLCTRPRVHLSALSCAYSCARGRVGLSRLLSYMYFVSACSVFLRPCLKKDRMVTGISEGRQHVFRKLGSTLFEAGSKLFGRQQAFQSSTASTVLQSSTHVFRLISSFFVRLGENRRTFFGFY